MKTTVTSRGQTVVPAALRRRYGIEEGTTLQWIDTGVEIRILPISRDVIAALRGSARGENLAARLRLARQRDRSREQR